MFFLFFQNFFDFHRLINTHDDNHDDSEGEEESYPTMSKEQVRNFDLFVGGIWKVNFTKKRKKIDLI